MRISSTVSNRLHRAGFGLGGLACVWLLATPLGAGQRGRPIQFSSPKSDTVSSNLHQLSAKQVEEELLRQKVKEDLLKPFANISRGSLEGVMVPPVRTPGPAPGRAQIKRSREWLERHKYWLFLSPEELAKDPAFEELFGGLEMRPEDEERKLLSPVERYYQRLDRGRFGFTNQLPGGIGLTNSETGLSALPGFNSPERTLGKTDPLLRELLNPQSAEGPLASSAAFPDLLRPLDAQLPRRSAAEQARAEEFRKFLDSRWPTTAATDAFAQRATPGGATLPATSVDKILGTQTRPAQTALPAATGLNPSAGFGSSAWPDLTPKPPTFSPPPTLPKPPEAIRAPKELEQPWKRKF